MKKKYFYAAVILLLFLVVGIQPAHAVILLTANGWDDGEGGDPGVGIWDPDTLTGTLTDDYVYETIQITSDGITLNGNDCTVTAVGKTGVKFNNKKYVTIRNLNVTGCVHGICLQNSSNNILTDNTVSGNEYGIRLYYYSDNNTLTNNTASDNTVYAIFFNLCSGNTLTGNTLTGDGSSSKIGIYFEYDSSFNTLEYNKASGYITGIQLRGSSNNIVTGNTVSSNSWGIRIRAYAGEESKNNQVYNNNFENTPEQQAEVYKEGTGDIDGNVFNLDNPTGGNFWNDWSGSGPYVIVPPSDGVQGVQDNLPWAEPDGWLLPDTTPPIISCPGNTTIEAMGPDGVPVDDERIQTFLAGASATDNCDPPEDIIITNNAPTLFPPGDTPVIFTATDTSGNSSTCQSTVTVVEAAERHLRIIPKIINREGRLEKILAVIRFPEGTTEEDIDIGQPLILYPGDSLDGIEATNQRVVTWYRWGTLRVSVFAFFSKDEVTAGVPEDGPVELMVIGRFTDGQYFYGLDNVWIISWNWPCW